MSHYATYGIIALQEMRKADGPVAVSALAAIIGIDYCYCQQVLRKLMVAGLVKSIRGGRGGFTLADRRRSIRLLDVIRAVYSQKEIVMSNDRARKTAQRADDAMATALGQVSIDSL